MNVLIIDDSLPIRSLLTKIVQSCGLPVKHVYHASNGFEGLSQLELSPVSLILCDINMPQMNGEEFVRNAKEDKRFRHIPILMITTDSSVARVHRLRELGADGYVCKPFTPDSIKEKVMTLVA